MIPSIDLFHIKIVCKNMKTVDSADFFEFLEI